MERLKKYNFSTLHRAGGNPPLNWLSLRSRTDRRVSFPISCGMVPWKALFLRRSTIMSLRRDTPDGIELLKLLPVKSTFQRRLNFEMSAGSDPCNLLPDTFTRRKLVKNDDAILKFPARRFELKSSARKTLINLKEMGMVPDN